MQTEPVERLGGLAGETTPTLGGVQASQEQHLSSLRRLASRATSIADHLGGGLPAADGHGQTPRPAGAVYALHENMMDSARLAEEIAFSLQRIEQALGISMNDGTSVPTSTGTARVAIRR